MMHPEDKTKIHELPGAQASLSGGTMESQPGGGKITPVSRTQTMELPTQQEQEAWADEASKTFNNPWESQEHNEAIRAKGGSAWKPKIYENSVEKSLLKLMKGGDEQELNPMEDPPKENEESQALVADGDSKRPKSEVGTNDKMFKKEHERTPEEEKEIYVQRQINQRNAPGEHPEMSDTQRLIAQILQQKEEDAKQKATRLAPPGTVYSSRGGEHGDEDYDGPIEKALLKLMKGGEISPAKVGMPRRAAIQPIENAFPAQAPKAPKGVGVSTASAPPPTAHEMEARRPDTDQAGQTANWSAQMFAGDLAGKINRRFGTGQQDMVEDMKRQQEAKQKFGEQYPTLARDANTPQADTTSQGFGDSGVEQQRQFQQQTGIMGNQGRPVPSSLLSSTKK